MTAGQWRVTALLTVLAAGFAIFLSLDFGHAAVLVTAAFVGGVVNGMLDNLDADRLPALSTPPRSKGLADVQALEFSLSGARAGVGVRAVNQLADIASAAFDARGIEHRTVKGPLGTVLGSHHLNDSATPVDTRTFDAGMDQLEQILRQDPQQVPGHRPAPQPEKDH
ncbi:hypothetical protein GCM10027403_05140 [Arthrobacter tecti]